MIKEYVIPCRTRLYEHQGDLFIAKKLQFNEKGNNLSTMGTF